jgi:hypothetical protein
MSNTDVTVVPATLDEIVKAQATDRTTALKALEAVTDRAALPEAVALAMREYRDTEAIDAAVSQAKAVLTQGKAAHDAHTLYRVRVHESILRVVPGMPQGDVAVMMFGPEVAKEGRTRTMMSRDRALIELRAASREYVAAAKAKDPKRTGLSTLSIPQAAAIVKANPRADARKSIVKAVRETGEVPVPEAEAKARTMAAVVKAAEALSDALAVDPTGITADNLAALRRILAKVNARADALAVAPAQAGKTA